MLQMGQPAIVGTVADWGLSDGCNDVIRGVSPEMDMVSALELLTAATLDSVPYVDSDNKLLGAFTAGSLKHLMRNLKPCTLKMTVGAYVEAAREEMDGEVRLLTNKLLCCCSHCSPCRARLWLSDCFAAFCDKAPISFAAFCDTKISDLLR